MLESLLSGDILQIVSGSGFACNVLNRRVVHISISTVERISTEELT